MIYIKYKLDKSKFHGIGLFTDEDLKKGQLVYTASPLLDVNITREQFDQLDEKEMTERTPEKITIDEESEAPYFIRKHNLDALNWEHRQILMKFLKVENEKREAWSKTEALKKKKAA